MVLAKPHFLLFCDAHASSSAAVESAPSGGRWHFVLERLDAAERLEATDGERSVPRERLSLLAVVRGLEALEQPSHVTLVTTSRYVSRGLRYGLSEWREANYSWEHFGIQKPIRNADLWQRIDGAMSFHEVACRLLESALSPNGAITEMDTELEGELRARDSVDMAPRVSVSQLANLGTDCSLAIVPGVDQLVKRSAGEADVPYAPAANALPLNALQRGAAATGTSRVVNRAAFVRSGRWGQGQHGAAWWQMARVWLQWMRSRSSRATLLAGY